MTMIHSITQRIMMVLCMVALTAAANAQNLAPNPGAEIWTSPTLCDGWEGNGGGTYSQSTQAYAGTYALQVDPVQAYGGVNLTTIPLEVGKTYTATCWIRGLAAGDTQPLRLMMYGGGSYPQDTTGNLSGTTYTQYSLTFTADATALNFNIVTWDAPAAGFQFLLDEVSITEVPTELINNGGLENWTAGVPDENWAAVDGATIAQSTDAHGGTSSLLINPNGINYAGINHWPVQVQGGQTYRLTCWMKGVSETDNGLVRLMFYGWGGGYPQTGYWISGTQWRQYSFLVTFEPGDTQKNLNIVAWDASGGFQFLVDDVSMDVAYPDNLVDDSSLETGWTSATLCGNWVGVDGGSYAQSTASRGAHNEGGQYAMLIDPGQAFGGVNLPVAGLEVGQTYDLTCWMRANDAASTQPMRLMMYGGGSYPQTTTGDLSPTDYHPYSLRFVADAAALNLNIVSWDAPANGFKCLLDDVVIEKVATAQVKNGAMEEISGRGGATWPLHWTGYDADYESWNEAATAFEGARAIYVTPHAPYQGLTQASIPVLGAGEYTLGVRLRRASGEGDDDELRLLVTEQGGASTPSHAFSTEEYDGATIRPEWQVFYLRFTTQADTTHVTLQIDNFFDPAATGEVTWALDDVQLLEGLVPVELSSFVMD